VILHVSWQEQARVLIGELPQGADVFEAVEQRFPQLIGAVAVFVCRNKSSSADQVGRFAFLWPQFAFMIFAAFESPSLRRGTA
jgi:hypothetical protein